LTCSGTGSPENLGGSILIKIHFGVPLALALLISLPALAQGPDRRPQERHDNVHGNQGRIPQAAPPHRDAHAKPEVERRASGPVNRTPHVSNDHWYGHDRPNDKHYFIAHPYEHGRFESFGPSNRYHVERFDRDHHRFWFPGGFSFEIASWDWDLAGDWCWDCGGDNFVVYDDPDHSGWYLIYNAQTGAHGLLSAIPHFSTGAVQPAATRLRAVLFAGCAEPVG
jgi:hypothetical protein